MITYEYRSFLVKRGTEDATAEYQEIFGYQLVSAADSLASVRLTFRRDMNDPHYELWRREERLHFRLVNDQQEIQQEINFIKRKKRFPTVASLVFWILMLAGLALTVWMGCSLGQIVPNIPNDTYFLGVGILVFITSLILYIFLVSSHSKKWNEQEIALKQDAFSLARIDHIFISDLASSKRVPLVSFDTIHTIEKKDQLANTVARQD
jgi:hypothetical protein